VYVQVVWGQAWLLAAVCRVTGERGSGGSLPPAPMAADSVSGVGSRQSLGWESATVTLGRVLGQFETWLQKAGSCPNLLTQLRVRGVWGAPGAKHVTSGERDDLCCCPSQEHQVCFLMQHLPSLIFARMRSESLFRNNFVQLLLVSGELERIYCKKLKALENTGKCFFFLLGKSNCCCRPFLSVQGL